MVLQVGNKPAVTSFKIDEFSQVTAILQVVQDQLSDKSSVTKLRRELLECTLRSSHDSGAGFFIAVENVLKNHLRPDTDFVELMEKVQEKIGQNGLSKVSIQIASSGPSASSYFEKVRERIDAPQGAKDALSSLANGQGTTNIAKDIPAKKQQPYSDLQVTIQNILDDASQDGDADLKVAKNTISAVIGFIQTQMNENSNIDRFSEEKLHSLVISHIAKEMGQVQNYSSRISTRLFFKLLGEKNFRENVEAICLHRNVFGKTKWGIGGVCYTETAKKLIKSVQDLRVNVRHQEKLASSPQSSLASDTSEPIKIDLRTNPQVSSAASSASTTHGLSSGDNSNNHSFTSKGTVSDYQGIVFLGEGNDGEFKPTTEGDHAIKADDVVKTAEDTNLLLNMVNTHRYQVVTEYSSQYSAMVWQRCKEVDDNFVVEDLNLPSKITAIPDYDSVDRLLRHSKTAEVSKKLDSIIQEKAKNIPHELVFNTVNLVIDIITTAGNPRVNYAKHLPFSRELFLVMLSPNGVDGSSFSMVTLLMVLCKKHGMFESGYGKTEVIQTFLQKLNRDKSGLSSYRELFSDLDLLLQLSANKQKCNTLKLILHRLDPTLAHVNDEIPKELLPYDQELFDKLMSDESFIHKMFFAGQYYKYKSVIDQGSAVKKIIDMFERFQSKLEAVNKTAAVAKNDVRILSPATIMIKNSIKLCTNAFGIVTEDLVRENMAALPPLNDMLTMLVQDNDQISGLEDAQLASIVTYCSSILKPKEAQEEHGTCREFEHGTRQPAVMESDDDQFAKKMAAAEAARTQKEQDDIEKNARAAEVVKSFVKTMSAKWDEFGRTEPSLIAEIKKVDFDNVFKCYYLYCKGKKSGATEVINNWLNEEELSTAQKLTRANTIRLAIAQISGMVNDKDNYVPYDLELLNEKVVTNKNDKFSLLVLIQTVCCNRDLDKKISSQCSMTNSAKRLWDGLDAKLPILLEEAGKLPTLTDIIGKVPSDIDKFYADHPEAERNTARLMRVNAYLLMLDLIAVIIKDRKKDEIVDLDSEILTVVDVYKPYDYQKFGELVKAITQIAPELFIAVSFTQKRIDEWKQEMTLIRPKCDDVIAGTAKKDFRRQQLLQAADILQEPAA